MEKINFTTEWFKVTDPLNPLAGCDVKGYLGDADADEHTWLLVTAMRKVDIFVGDRPFQLFAKDGENLGVMVSCDHLETAAFQDDIMEIGSDRPFGMCLNESEMTRGDGCTLRVARYERATQIAVENQDGDLIESSTVSNLCADPLRLWEDKIVSMFERGDDQDDISYALRN